MLHQPHSVEIVDLVDGQNALRVTVERFSQEGGKLIPEHSGGFITYNHDLEVIKQMQEELLPAVQSFIQKDVK